MDRDTTGMIGPEMDVELLLPVERATSILGRRQRLGRLRAPGVFDKTSHPDQELSSIDVMTDLHQQDGGGGAMLGSRPYGGDSHGLVLAVVVPS